MNRFIGCELFSFVRTCLFFVFLFFVVVSGLFVWVFLNGISRNCFPMLIKNQCYCQFRPNLIWTTKFILIRKWTGFSISFVLWISLHSVRHGAGNLQVSCMLQEPACQSTNIFWLALKCYSIPAQWDVPFVY